MTSNLKSDSDHNQNYGTIEDNSKNEAKKAKGNHFFNNKTEKSFNQYGLRKYMKISLNWRKTDDTIDKKKMIDL